MSEKGSQSGEEWEDCKPRADDIDMQNNESDEESDDDDSDDSESDQPNEENVDVLSKQPLSPNSTPICYICLNEFEDQDVGSPDSCEDIHRFCLECIEEWSKVVSF